MGDETHRSKALPVFGIVMGIVLGIVLALDIAERSVPFSVCGVGHFRALFARVQSTSA